MKTLSPQTIKTIHPFPARMAPEIAFTETASLPRRSLVLDPMTGSGTSVRIASEQGHRAKGFDLDPLAVLMSKVWTTPIKTKELRKKAFDVATRGIKLARTGVELPWIDNDVESTNFIKYWFDARQEEDLRRICSLLIDDDDPLADAMRIAISRIIITKKRGASLAWDVSHSRPHKKRTTNDFPVISEFIRSTEFIAKRLEDQPPPGRVRVGIADARQLQDVRRNSVDCVLTSPPYLNALDYLRGHKFALIWFGHSISQLRATRSASIGSERGPNAEADINLAETLCAPLNVLEHLPPKEQQMIKRYALDVYRMMGEMYRVLKPRGKAVLVVGNSCLKGVFVQNSLLVSTTAERVGFQSIRERERNLPNSRRYLPPPTDTEESVLNKRMRTETILTFIKP